MGRKLEVAHASPPPTELVRAAAPVGRGARTRRAGLWFSENAQHVLDPLEGGWRAFRRRRPRDRGAVFLRAVRVPRAWRFAAPGFEITTDAEPLIREFRHRLPPARGSAPLLRPFSGLKVAALEGRAAAITSRCRARRRPAGRRAADLFEPEHPGDAD